MMRPWHLLAVLIAAASTTGNVFGRRDGDPWDDAGAFDGDMGGAGPALIATVVRTLDGTGQHRHLLTKVALAPMPPGCELVMLENLSKAVYVDTLDSPAVTPAAATRTVFERPDIEAPTINASPQLALVWLPPSVFEARPYGEVEVAMPVHTRYQMPHSAKSAGASPAPFVLAAPVIYTRCIIDRDSHALDLRGGGGDGETQHAHSTHTQHAQHAQHVQHTPHTQQRIPCSGISSGVRSLIDCAAELTRGGWSPVFVDDDAGAIVLTGVPVGQRDDAALVLIVTVGSVLAAAAWLAAGIKQNAERHAHAHAD